jgi:hypothetical protein
MQMLERGYATLNTNSDTWKGQSKSTTWTSFLLEHILRVSVQCSYEDAAVDRTRAVSGGSQRPGTGQSDFSYLRDLLGQTASEGMIDRPLLFSTLFDVLRVDYRLGM